MKIELDREKKIAREEIQALHTQLQDTADAVQAAGELLVRLKEAEEATSIAKVKQPLLNPCLIRQNPGCCFHGAHLQN